MAGTGAAHAKPAAKPVKPMASAAVAVIASKPVPAPHVATPSPPQADAKPSPAAILADAGAARPSDAAAAGRFVVQVGAFTDDAKVREARGKVEKLGLKTYTQQVDTPAGKRVRVRVGPFATKAEADKVMARIKAAGLQPGVLAL
jgi:DedD protein